MFRPRIIPVLLLKNRALVKSVRFRGHRYIGDPLNAAKIFNDLRADELILLDIEASKQGRLVPLDLVSDIGEELRMPFAVGGGIRSTGDIQALLGAGAERVVINTRAGQDPEFVKRAADKFGSTTVAVCIDVKKKFFGSRKVWVLAGSKATRFEPVEFAVLMAKMGAGELIIQSIDRDGTMSGYDIDLIRAVSTAVDVPVVALGGAGKIEHLKEAYIEGCANGLAAGSLFVYQGANRGVLINYPDKNDLAFSRE